MEQKENLMPHLHRLSDIYSRHSEDFHGEGIYNPVGSRAYIGGSHQVGTVRDVLVDDDHGKIRYLIVDQDGGDLNGAVLVPIGLARLEDGAVHFDDLSSAQFSGLHRYSEHEDYTFDLQSNDERVLRGASSSVSSTDATSGERVLHGTGAASTASAHTVSTGQARYDYRDHDTADRLFKAPDRLQLLEERLTVNKERYLAGQVQIGKHVETRQETVQVPLQREEIVIERHAVTDARPVQGEVLESGSETIRVELEAERVDVNKQAFVTEEIEVGKRAVTQQETVTETVGREVLDVNQTGEVRVVSGEEELRDDRHNGRK